MDQETRRSRAERINLWVLPLVVFVLLLAGHVWVWRSARTLTYELVEQSSANSAEQVSLRLGLLLHERRKDAAHLSSLWRNYAPGVREEHFTKDAGGIVTRESDYHSISFVDTLGRVRLIKPDTAKPAPAQVNIRALLDMYRRGARQDTTPFVMSLDQFSGEKLLLLLLPTYSGTSLDGFVVSSLHLAQIIDKVTAASVPSGFRMRIEMDGHMLHETRDALGDSSRQEKGGAVRATKALGRTWRVAVEPPVHGGLRGSLLWSNYLRFLINLLGAAIASILLAVALRATYRARASRHKLELSEQRYRRLAENARDIIFRMTLPDGKYQYISPACRDLLGYAPEEFYAEPGLFRQIIDPQWRDYYDRQWELLLSGKAPPTYEYKISHRNGESRWMYQRNVVSSDAEGNPVAIEGIVTDVTERKNVAEERERLIKELEAKNADLERFTYTVSHELKTPLITIRGFLGYLEEEAASGDLGRLHDDLTRIQAATETMRHQLNDLIQLSRVGRGRGDPEEIDMSALAQQAVELLADRIRESQVTVKVDKKMPVVKGYRSELLELYKNLIENAVKFTSTAADPRIDIGFKQEDGHVIFFVGDNGIGVDPRYQERIFGLFNKLDPHSEGTGVGLALARRIAMAHGGWIRVESAGAGKGSLFYFELPMSD